MSFNLDKELLLRIQSNVEYIKDHVHNIELKQQERLSDIHQILIKQEQNLNEHMARSNALEKQVNILEKDVRPILDSMKFLKILFSIMSALMTLSLMYIKFKS